jgi:hypothetical protein
MRRVRIWFTPFPGLGLRGVATKRLIGWTVVCRDYAGKCFTKWVPTLDRKWIVRDASPQPKDLSRPRTHRTRVGDRYI